MEPRPMPSLQVPEGLTEVLAAVFEAVVALAQRVRVVEGHIRTGAQEGAAAVQAVAPQQPNDDAPLPMFDVPQRLAWSKTDGRCPACQLSWRHDSAFPMDENSWEQLMNAVFADWSLERRTCCIKSSWIFSPDNIAQSLHSLEIIADAQSIGNRLRNQLWQPDIARNKWFHVQRWQS